MERKLIKHGPSSSIMTLPAQWMRDRLLKAGDSVVVLTDGDKLIITSTQPPEQRDITLNISGLDRTSIVLLIRSAYRLGYAKMVLQYTEKYVRHYRAGGEISTIAVVSEEITKLIGIEITDQKEGVLVVSEVTKPTAQELLNMYRKAFTMTHQLITQIADTSEDEDIGVQARHDVITKIISYAIRIMIIGEANLASREKIRMMHSLMLLDIIIDILKHYHRDFNVHTQMFLLDLALAFVEMEKIVFGHERKAIVSFQEIKHRLCKEPIDRLLPITDILSDMILLHATN